MPSNTDSLLRRKGGAPSTAANVPVASDHANSPRPPSETASQPPTSEPPLGACRILLVSDDGVLNSAILPGLEKLGCYADMAATSREALARAAADRPDLVILNVGSEDLGGVDLLRRLKTEAAARYVVAFVSMFRLKVVREEVLAAGADRIYSNSVLVGHLSDMVRDALTDAGGGAEEARAASMVVCEGPRSAPPSPTIAAPISIAARAPGPAIVPFLRDVRERLRAWRVARTASGQGEAVAIEKVARVVAIADPAGRTAEEVEQRPAERLPLTVPAVWPASESVEPAPSDVPEARIARIPATERAEPAHPSARYGAPSRMRSSRIRQYPTLRWVWEEASQCLLLLCWLMTLGLSMGAGFGALVERYSPYRLSAGGADRPSVSGVRVSSHASAHTGGVHGGHRQRGRRQGARGKRAASTAARPGMSPGTSVYARGLAIGALALILLTVASRVWSAVGRTSLGSRVYGMSVGATCLAAVLGGAVFAMLVIESHDLPPAGPAVHATPK